MSIVTDIFKNVGRLVKAVRVAHNFTKASVGTFTLSPASSVERNVLIVVKVTETFAAGTGAKPTFKLGQTSSVTKYADTTAFSSGVKGDILTFAGTLTSTKALLVTVVAATGTGTGSIAVEAIILPATA